MPIESFLLALTLAVVLDLLLGDPTWLPHPIRWMGWAIERFEPGFRALPTSLQTSGALMVVGLVLYAWCLGLLVVSLAAAIHPIVGILVQAVLIYTCISARGLADAAASVATALNTAGLEAGRRAVAMIVGRETDRLDATAVRRASVETVAENLVDGVIAPLFFAIIGGVPLALAYKMVNTLDSMIGYKNERYWLFGRFAARLDDVANWLPARFGVLFIALAAQLIHGSGRKSLATAIRDGRAHASPNAGWPEAAFAGALGIWMGGPSHYHGRLVDKPIIGAGMADTAAGHIDQACRLMLASTILFFFFSSAALLLLQATS